MYCDRRLLILIVPVLCFLLLTTGLYLGHDHLSQITKLHIPFLDQSDHAADNQAEAAPETPNVAPPTTTTSASEENDLFAGIQDGNRLQTTCLTRPG